MNNRKGLSNIVVTILIVLLALAAVVIVANFILPLITNAGTSAGLQGQCLNDVGVAMISCNATAGTVNVRLEKGSPVEVVGILKNSAGVTSSASVAAETIGAITSIDVDTTAFTSEDTLVGSASVIVADPADASNTLTCESLTITEACSGAVVPAPAP